MAARAMWKGVIRGEGVDVPVKLYSAVEDRTVRFRLLHEEDHVPVKQRMVRADTGDEVPYADALRAFDTEDGRRVILTREDLAALEPPESRDIEILRFLHTAAIDHPWYDRPYYLGPDGSSGPYRTLTEAMQASERSAVVRWVMRKKTYRGALRAEDDVLMLVTLHAAEEMIPVSALLTPEGRSLRETEVEMARQLVDALTEDFDPTAYENEYRARVMELIRAKAAGEVVAFPEAPERKPEADLTAALERSLKSARERRSA